MDNVPQDKKNKFLYDIYDLLSMICYSSAIVFILSLLLFRPVTVKGDSMLPTFHDRDMILIKSFLYEPSNGDVVVLDTSNKNLQHPHIIKRVIACEGDVVDIDPLSGKVSVNGEFIDEPYIKSTIKTTFGDFVYPLTVEPGKVFVLGDNREGSLDSRFIQIDQMDKRYITGEVIFRYFPFNNMTTNFDGK